MPPHSPLEASRERHRWFICLVVYALVFALLWVVRVS